MSEYFPGFTLQSTSSVSVSGIFQVRKIMTLKRLPLATDCQDNFSISPFHYHEAIPRALDFPASVANSTIVIKAKPASEHISSNTPNQEIIEQRASPLAFGRSYQVNSPSKPVQTIAKASRTVFYTYIDKSISNKRDKYKKRKGYPST